MLLFTTLEKMLRHYWTKSCNHNFDEVVQMTNQFLWHCRRRRNTSLRRLGSWAPLPQSASAAVIGIGGLRELHLKARSCRLRLPLAHPLPNEDGHSTELPRTLTGDARVSHQRGVEQNVTPRTRQKGLTYANSTSCTN